jgi:hypothetical protein
MNPNSADQNLIVTAFWQTNPGEAAFAEHQQTRHFKDIILGQALPKLAKRERAQFRYI